MRYVVDQNVMRHSELGDLVRTESDSDFILPDTALIEMCKSEKWEETMRGSLARLSSVPHRVYSAIGYGEAIRSELERRKPITIADLLPEDHTRLIRQVMVSMSLGGDTLDRLKVQINEVRKPLVDDQIDAGAEKQVVGTLIRSFLADAGGTRVAAMRQSHCDAPTFLALVQHVAEITLGHLLIEGHHWSVEETADFVASKPFLLRHYILRVRQAARWIVDHGFNNVDPDRILNDRFDQEYLVIGSYFDAILTRDRRAREADQELRFILNDATSATLRRVFRDIWDASGSA